MSIRKKLTIIMLFIGLVPTLVVSVIAYIIISNSLIGKTADQLESTATKQEQRINGLLQKRQEEALELTNKFDLQATLGKHLTQNGDVAEALTAILIDKKVATPDIQTIHLADLNGKVIASTLQSAQGTKLAEEDARLAEGQEEIRTTVREDPRDGINKLYITTKISVNKKPAALLSMVFRIDDIMAAIQDYTGLGVTGETLVVEKNAEGNATSLFPLRFDTDAALKVNLNSLQLFESFPNGYREATDYRGERVMVAGKSIGFADWTLATKIDLSEALAQTDQLRNSLIIVGIATSAAIVVIALSFTRLFTKPILAITNAAQAIGRGDLDSRVAVTRTDEIGTLAESVNSMGQSLKDFVTSIEEQRNRLEVVLNSTAESILAIDKHGDIIIANQATCELTQLGMQLIVGQNIADIFHWSQDGEPFIIDYSEVGTQTYPDLQYTDSEGFTHYIKLVIVRLSKERERRAQAIVTIHDETKSRELEAMKVDFVSMAAHELRTPLAAIRGYLELITFKKKTPTPDTDTYLKQALNSTSELGALIDNLLDVTRIERGTLSFNPEKVDLAADVAQAVKDAQFSAKDKHLQLTYDGPTDGHYVVADQIGLHEVINNLLTNAIKYTHAPGTVSVALSEENETYRVSVKDTGMGIPRQALPHLFTKFYRVQGGLNSDNTGTGLGLFISKSIIERHNGTIACTSEEGVGSTFTFTLPKFDPSRLEALHAQGNKHITPLRRHHGWTTKNIAR